MLSPFIKKNTSDIVKPLKVIELRQETKVILCILHKKKNGRSGSGIYIGMTTADHAAA